MVQIIPAILSKTEENFKVDILRYDNLDYLKEDWVHIDFMDNIFVPNESIKPSVVSKYPVFKHKEAHLMVLSPLEWIDGLTEAGFERIIIHVESQDVEKCLEYIKSKGLEAGIAINNETPVESLQPFIDKIDVVLVMTIKPGFQGQPFIPEALEKVRQIKSNNLSVKVGVDGGVRDTNVKEIVESGVDFMTAGSYLLEGDIEENLEKLWEVIYG